MARRYVLPFRPNTKMRGIAEMIVTSGKKGVTNQEVVEKFQCSNSVLGMVMKYLEYYGFTPERVAPDGTVLQSAMGVPMRKGQVVRYRATPPPPDFVAPKPPKDYADLMSKHEPHSVVMGANPYVKGSVEWKAAEYILKGKPVTTNEISEKFPEMDRNQAGSMIRLLMSRGAQITDRWGGTRPVRKVYTFTGWGEPTRSKKTTKKKEQKPEQLEMAIPEAAATTIVTSEKPVSRPSPGEIATDVVDSVPSAQLADAIARTMWARYEWALTELGALKDAIAIRDAEIKRLQALVDAQPEPTTADIARRFLVDTA
jgi:hypothetical protein